ncbi:MAG: hypothetical protein ACD_24C00105G0001, partial [uncultured bacterium]
ELVGIVGPSGCGKSTLLNIIAGLIEQDKGAVKISAIPWEKRLGRISYMQQKDLLFPWRSVLDNAILGLEINGMFRDDARQKAIGIIDTFGLRGFENQYPFTLSGGMRQRLAFLRTVLLDQDILLLDEPFGALDNFTRVKMREWLQSLWESFNKTIILVTHDIDEALFLSDRVYVFSKRPGRIALEQVVNLKRPRDRKIVISQRFMKMKKRLLERLFYE